MGKLLIVGTVAFDAIETPFGKTDKIVGGTGVYIALAASHFDISSAIVSVVGDDFPQEYLEMLEKKNVHIQSIERVKGGKTFYWKGKYHNDLNSRDTIDTHLNVLADFNPIVPESFKEPEVLILGNLHPEVQIKVLDQMRSRPNLTIMDTMNFWMEHTPVQLSEILSRVDAITINDEEARQLSGEYSLVRAAQRIHEMGPKYVVIKKGEHGALLFHQGEIFFAPALPLEEVFDPTGAGDTFAGGFAGYLTASGDYSFENMKNAVIHGSNLASFCVEEFGPNRMERLQRDEVMKRLNQFKELTQFDIRLA